MPVEIFQNRNKGRYPTGDLYSLSRMTAWLTLEQKNMLLALSPDQVSCIMDLAPVLFSEKQRTTLAMTNSYHQLNHVASSFADSIAPKMVITGQLRSLLTWMPQDMLKQRGVNAHDSKKAGWIYPQAEAALSILNTIAKDDELKTFNREGLYKMVMKEVQAFKNKSFPHPFDIEYPELKEAAERLKQTAPRVDADGFIPDRQDGFWGLQTVQELIAFGKMADNQAVTGFDGFCKHPAFGQVARRLKKQYDSQPDLFMEVAMDSFRLAGYGYCPSFPQEEKKSKTEQMSHPNYSGYLHVAAKNNLGQELMKSGTLVKISRNALRLENYLSQIIAVSHDPQLVCDTLAELPVRKENDDFFKSQRTDCTDVTTYLAKHPEDVIKAVCDGELTRPQMVKNLVTLSKQAGVVHDALDESERLLLGLKGIVSLDAPAGDSDSDRSLHEIVGGDDLPDLIEQQSRSSGESDIQFNPVSVMFEDYEKNHLVEPQGHLIDLAMSIVNATQQEKGSTPLTCLRVLTDIVKGQVAVPEIDKVGEVLDRTMPRMAEPAKRFLQMAATGPALNDLGKISPVVYHDETEQTKLAELLATKAANASVGPQESQKPKVETPLVEPQLSLFEGTQQSR